MGKKARIIQASFNDKGFVIHKSALYDFSTVEKRKSAAIDPFLLYMASEPVSPWAIRYTKSPLC
jgi:hypothetical protein